MRNPWIKLKESLNQEDCRIIGELEKTCVLADGTSMKLELDYKLGVAAGRPEARLREVNELMYFDGDALVGYIGIGSFGGTDSPPEIMGMVRPDYRKRGVFSALHSLAMAELKRRGCASALLLSDGRSSSGLAFIRKTGATHHHSEYEMHLRREGANEGKPGAGVTLRKATNADAREIARQDAIYFGDRFEQDPGEGNRPLPEEEERRGMAIYLVERENRIIGKVNLQLLKGVGGIYGLGVLPEFRGRGYGRTILSDAVRQLNAAGSSDITLQVSTGNANALALYESCGFETTATMDYYELKL